MRLLAALILVLASAAVAETPPPEAPAPAPAPAAPPLAPLVVVETRREGATRVIRLQVNDTRIQKISWRGAGGSRGPAVRAAPLLELELPAETEVTVVGVDDTGAEIMSLVLPSLLETVGVAHAPVALDEPFPWLLVGGATGGAIVLGTAAVILGVVLTRPSTVTLKSAVVFGE